MLSSSSSSPANAAAALRLNTIVGHFPSSSSSASSSLQSRPTYSTTGVYGPSSLTFGWLQKLQSNFAGKKAPKSTSTVVPAVPHASDVKTTRDATSTALTTEIHDDDIRLHDGDQRVGVIAPEVMRRVLDRWMVDERKAIMAKLGSLPSFQHFHGIGQTLPEQRAITQQQVEDFSKNIKSFDFSHCLTDPLRWITHLELLYYHGCTVATKAGVHYGLFGSTLMNLGSPAQRAYFAPKIQSLEIRGCFCLTELGHGSNAREIETIATWDQRAKEFVLLTPTETAQKIYIGNLAVHANWAIVFAQLIVGAKHVGVHAFVIQIRDDTPEHNNMKNVRIADCGPKAGLNGVDNGRLWLDNYRCGVGSILNRFGDVNPETGAYFSAIASPLRRFTATIGQLVGGRIIVGQGAVHASKVGLIIAVKYAHTRKQFGPPGKPEAPIMNFLSHQLRLMPMLARTYALQFGFNRCKQMFEELHKQAEGPEKESLNKEMHVLAAGLKPMSTWSKNECLQICRECCGGFGFLAVNRIATLRMDSDIDVTWEGDNTVLLQQVSSSLLKEYKDQYTPPKDGGSPAKFRGMLKYLGDEAATVWASSAANPLAQRFNNSKRQLRDLDFYSQAFEFREERLLRALVNRLGRAPKDGSPKLSDFDAWNGAMDLVLELAKAHVERQLINTFIEQIERIEKHPASEAESQLLPILRQLCSLYALHTIQSHMGFYLTFSFFSTVKSKLIWETINHLCAQITPHSIALVNSFGVPDSFVSAPIAADWKDAYTYPNVPGYVKIVKQE